VNEFKHTAIGALLNRHAGEDAWVFGKGPSLDGFDMGVAGALRICINESAAVVPTPSYFFAHDCVPIERVAVQWPEGCKAVLEDGKVKHAVDSGIPQEAVYQYSKRDKDKSVLFLSPEEIAEQNILHGMNGTVHSALHFFKLVGVRCVHMVGFDGTGGYAACVNVDSSEGRNHKQINRHTMKMLKLLRIPMTVWPWGASHEA